MRTKITVRCNGIYLIRHYIFTFTSLVSVFRIASSEFLACRLFTAQVVCRICYWVLEYIVAVQGIVLNVRRPQCSESQKMLISVVPAPIFHKKFGAVRANEDLAVWHSYGCRVFSVAGPTVWNSLPDFIRDLSRISSGTRPSVQSVSDVCLKCLCLLDTSAFSALEVREDYCAI